MNIVMIFILFYLFFYSIAHLLDTYSWNNGICRENGEPWVLTENNTTKKGNFYKAGDIVEQFIFH